MVNQYLYSKLSEITTSVYPDFIPMSVEFPAIMIELVELSNERYKGGSDVTYQTWAVHIVSPTVEARNLLTLEVIDKIEHKSDPAYYVDDCVLIDSSTTWDKDVEMYIGVLVFEIRVKDHEAYDVDAFDWDFEGTLTVGEFEGEGAVMEYGYRAGWGDDYGSIANFYTYYEYAGIYWIDGILYVWGVDVDILQINDTNYTNGTYNSSGYTTFPFATNPLDGATAAIKIKGTNMETWDYEWVMTVGKDLTNEEFDFLGYYIDSDDKNYGSITPIFPFVYFDNVLYYKFINWNNEELHIKLSIKATYLKIDNSIYINESDIGWNASEYYSESSPFPSLGETCTIKIKL